MHQNPAQQFNEFAHLLHHIQSQFQGCTWKTSYIVVIWTEMMLTYCFHSVQKETKLYSPKRTNRNDINLNEKQKSRLRRITSKQSKSVLSRIFDRRKCSFVWDLPNLTTYRYIYLHWILIHCAWKPNSNEQRDGRWRIVYIQSVSTEK